MATIGVPYAAAGFDADGYYVRCPECDRRCRPTDLRDEDGVTKSASLAYGVHYQDEHGPIAPDGMGIDTLLVDPSPPMPSSLRPVITWSDVAGDYSQPPEVVRDGEGRVRVEDLLTGRLGWVRLAGVAWD